MLDLQVTVQTILTIFGGITCIAAGVSAIVKMFNPLKEMQKKVSDHDSKLQKDYEHLNELDDAIKDIEKSNRVMCKSLLALLNHEITGNGIDKLKEQREVLEQFLIDK